MRVLDLQKLLHGEYDENEVRKDFTPTEKVAIGQAIEAVIAAENAARQQEGRKQGGKTAGSALHVMLFFENLIRALLIFNGLRSRYCQRALLVADIEQVKNEKKSFTFR